MGYSRTVRKKIREPVKVSLGLKICPLTDYDLLLCPMLLVIFIHLVIFLVVCWEIWQVHLFDKFTLIFDLTEWLLLDDKICQPSLNSTRINLSSSEKKPKFVFLWYEENNNNNNNNNNNKKLQKSKLSHCTF